MKVFGSEAFISKRDPLKQMIRDGIPTEFRTKVQSRIYDGDYIGDCIATL
jgi:hypothetical protein